MPARFGAIYASDSRLAVSQLLALNVRIRAHQLLCFRGSVAEALGRMWTLTGPFDGEVMGELGFQSE